MSKRFTLQSQQRSAEFRPQVNSLQERTGTPGADFQVPANLDPVIGSRLRRLRATGDRLTGGGLRALARRIAGTARATGDRLTGGGLRALAKRVLTTSIRFAMRQPAVRALGRKTLQPFPHLSQRLYRLVTAFDTVPLSDTMPARSVKDCSPLVHSLYKTAFGRPADPDGLANCIRRLQSGVSVECLAEELVLSPEFEARHGSRQEVDFKYIRALYRDGLEQIPGLESLAFWLAQGDRGATRAKVLAAVATSEEAIERALLPPLNNQMDYNRWVAVNDTITNMDRAVIRAHIAVLPFHPVISVAMTIGRTSHAALLESLKSVATQLYPYWELCITSDEHSELLVRGILGNRRTRDRRIKVAQEKGHQGAAAMTNAALTFATGEYVAFFRPGDILPEQALYEVALELAGNPGTEIVYSDHDQIDRHGQRHSPWFKPGWDPDLLLAHNYISNLFVCRRTLIEAIGFLRPGFEGAELHDLVLRATAATSPDRIRHVPAILYHCRSEDTTNKSDDLNASAASRRAVRSHLDSTGYSEAILKPAPQMPKATRVVWPLPQQSPLVSVIILTRDRADLLARCVEGVLHRTDYSNLEVLIVDNESIEPATLTLLERLSREESPVRILRCPGPFNYAGLNNAAARQAKGEVLLLLNNDVDVIDSGWLRELVSHAVRPDVGIAGAKLIYANELIQHGGVVLGLDDAIHLHRFADRNDPGYSGQLALARTLAAVTGACAAIRRSVFFEVGGFDEVHLAVTYNDVDLCLRLADHGYRAVWTPFAELFHLESVSRGLIEVHPAKQQQALCELEYLRKTWLALPDPVDPFYNPNLLFAQDHLEVPSLSRRCEKPWHSVFEQVFSLNRHISK
jgi:O-antigen biosynthesis protein